MKTIPFGARQFLRLLTHPTVLLLGLSLMFGHARALGADYVWTNLAGGNWNTAANWEPNRVPGASDNARITGDGTYTVTLDTSPTVASLTFGGSSGTKTLVINNGTLTLLGASLANSNGIIHLNGGTIAGAGAFVVDGLLLWTAGDIASVGGVTASGTLVIASTAQRDLSGVLRNGGQGRWDAGVIRILYGGVLENLATGVMDLTFDGATTTYDGGRTIHNAGLWRKSGGSGTATLNAPFNNSGTVCVWQGVLHFAEGLNLSPASTVECSLAGVNHPNDHGRIASSQSLPLAGRLAVTFRNGFIPGLGLQFDVVAAPIVGQFESIAAPTISPHVFINPVHLPNLVRLVTADSTPITAGRPSFDNQGRLGLNIQGIANELYAVEASTNLVEWAALKTNTIPVSTLWQFVDEESVSLLQRFHRVMFLP